MFLDVPANPTEAASRAALAVYRDHRCAGICAVGGGSPIDLAKCVALLGFERFRMVCQAAWNGGTDVSQQQVRSVEPVKINEVRFVSHLVCAGTAVDHSRRHDDRAAFALPAGPRDSGLVAPAAAGATTVNLRSTADLSPGTEIIIGGERRTVKSAGTAATAPTKVFINVSTGPWLDFPAGTTNLPVHSAEGCDARREAHFYRV